MHLTGIMSKSHNLEWAREHLACDLQARSKAIGDLMVWGCHVEPISPISTRRGRWKPDFDPAPEPDCGISWSLSSTLWCRDLPVGTADRHITKGTRPEGVTHPTWSHSGGGAHYRQVWGRFGRCRGARVRPGRNVISIFRAVIGI